MSSKNKTLLVGIIFSIILLLMFLIIKTFKPVILELDVKWIAVSILPLILSLILGGYIKSFKGFGFEVEANLQKEISTNFKLLPNIEVEKSPMLQKGLVDKLEKTPKEELDKIKRLTFIYGKKHYYGAGPVLEYLNSLSNLEYFEIVDEEGKFKYLLKLNSVLDSTIEIHNNIEKFIQSLEDQDLPYVYANHLESDTIRSNETTIEVYEKLKDSKLKVLPIVDSSKKMIGIIDLNKLALNIADKVIKLKKEN